MEYKLRKGGARTAKVNFNLELNESNVIEVNEKGFGRKNLRHKGT
jgi:hypothetical protein